MPPLETYRRDLPYSYAAGFFPCMEALRKRPELVQRVLISSQAQPSQTLDELQRLCDGRGIRIEQADRALSRILGKGNTFAAAVFEKKEATLDPGQRHLVLHMPGDKGNIGTILRTALGFGFLNIAIIRPAADPFDPHVVRAAMGAHFSLNLRSYADFNAYRCEYPDHQLYPLMLGASIPLDQAAQQKKMPYALVLGNEGSGLPEAFAALGQPIVIPHSDAIDSLNLGVAAAIAMYAFSRKNEDL